MLAHEVTVLAPEIVALPMAAILDVPVPADMPTEARGCHPFGPFGRHAADEVAHGGSAIPLLRVQGFGLRFDDTLGEGEAGGLRCYRQQPDAAPVQPPVLVLYLTFPKRGGDAPGCLASKQPVTCLWSVGWLSLRASR